MIINRLLSSATLAFLLLTITFPAHGAGWGDWWFFGKQTSEQKPQAKTSESTHFWLTAGAALAIPVSVLGWKWYEAESKKKKDLSKLRANALVNARPNSLDARRAPCDGNSSAYEDQLVLEDTMSALDKTLERLAKEDHYRQPEKSEAEDHAHPNQENRALTPLMEAMNRTQSPTEQCDMDGDGANQLSIDAEIEAAEIRLHQVRNERIQTLRHVFDLGNACAYATRDLEDAEQENAQLKAAKLEIDKQAVAQLEAAKKIEADNRRQFCESLALKMEREREDAEHYNSTMARASAVNKDIDLMTRRVRAMDRKLYMHQRSYNTPLQAHKKAYKLRDEVDGLTTPTYAVMREARSVIQEIQIMKKDAQVRLYQIRLAQARAALSSTGSC